MENIAPFLKNFFNCLNLLIILYKKKIEIASLTQINVDKILENFSTENSALLHKYENILKYLNNTTKHLNKYIETNNNYLKDIDINSCFVNVSTLLTKHNTLPIFIGKVFNYLITDPIFQNSEIINKLTKCIPKHLKHCEKLVPSDNKIYTYFSKIELIERNEEINQRKGINSLLASLPPPPYDNIPKGFRIVINVIKNKSRLLIPLDKVDSDKKLDELLFFNEEGEEILFDLTLNQISDEELLAGVPDNALQTLLEDHGYTCMIEDVEMDEASGIKTIKRKKRKKKLKKKTKKRQVHPKKKHARHRTQHRLINRPRTQKRLSKR